MAVDEHSPSEPDRVEAWRLDQLIRAGYPLTVADRIASRLDIDLRQAAAMLEHGCDPMVAAEILL